MKRLLFAGSVFVAGLILAGCQLKQVAPESTITPPKASPVAKASPLVKATPAAQSADDKDLKVIDDQLSKLDAAKDFPTVSESDF